MMEYKFQVADYAILIILLFLPALYGLYVSNVKHKQSTLMEYFLGGKNLSVLLVMLSYFSTFCAGGLTGQAIEIYLFGSQNMAYMFIWPVMILVVQYLIIPVIYPLQNMSMLKYFEIRFGKEVAAIALLGSVTGMILTGSVNIYVSAIIIQQVSAISFWVAAIIITAWCIIYSALGGMRGIVVTDAIQALIMIASLLILFVIGIVKCGGLKEIWEIIRIHDRLELFNFNFDPTIRYTFWSAFLGFGLLNLCFNAINQSLLQRCILVSNIKSAQKIATLGISISLIYMLIFQVLGLIIFAYYKGCHVQKSGKIRTINQLNSYFAMEILYEYATLPGIFFSGMLCGTSSTISSFLNSVAALIVGYFKPNFTRGATLCKVLVALSGLVMFSILFLMEKFQNFAQANITFIAIIHGPAFAVYCIGILCPQSNSKCVAASYLMSLAFGFYILVGSLLTKSNDIPKQFANCSNNVLHNLTAVNVSVNTNHNNYNVYFPLNNISYLYITLEAFLVTIIVFILLFLIIGKRKENNMASLVHFDLNLIPPCVQKLHLRLNKKWRKILLCDVYDCINQPQDIPMISNEHQNIISDISNQ